MRSNKRGFFKRLHIKLKIWWRNRTSTKFEYDNEHQEKAVSFVNKMLRHPDSELIFTPNSDTYYIENPTEDVHLVIHSKFIGIINSTYNSDAIISDKLHEIIKDKFDKRVKQNHEKSRDKLQERQRSILTKIYEKHVIEKKEE